MAGGKHAVSTDLSDQIADNAEGVAEATIDGNRVRQHPLRDQIAADKHLATKQAVRNNRTSLGLRFAKIVPPGGA